jgi:hypothetical protein
MPVAWPGTLPALPLLDGFREQVPNAILRTTMDAGPPKQRRRYTAAVRTLNVELELTKAQVAVLDDFILNALNGGVDSFTWTHPRTGGAATYRIAGKTPEYSIWTGGSDNNWVTTLLLEILP